jgi:proteic killer suppression protein
MIVSFRDNATLRLWMDGFAKRFSGIEKQALRKLDMLHNARSLNDLRAPPANRLEALAGDRRGQHSIRIKRSVAHLLHVDQGGAGQCRNRRLPLKRSQPPIA